MIFIQQNILRSLGSEFGEMTDPMLWLGLLIRLGLGEIFCHEQFSTKILHYCYCRYYISRINVKSIIKPSWIKKGSI